jgi:excisionase family DNA binding protein
MDNGFNLNVLLESLSELLSDRVVSKLTGRGGAVARATRLLTVEQTAIYLGIAQETIQHMIAKGKLPTVRSERHVLIDVDDLDRWIVDNKRKELI